ncbi:hypothetical protein AYJ70_02305 [Pseudomonas monteilii]|uniref:Uncharacterized protein n=1 Tax=Pseudomonas monteilii TaxID=76759 RepID=A0AAP7FKN2_9PSED|nr:hypothetical protein AYJ70_02305 [Pseudomonas monteilii]
MVALADQPGFVVVPAGAAVQGVGVAEQAAFGVVLEAVFGLVGVDQAAEVTGVVVVLGGFPGALTVLLSWPSASYFNSVVLPEQSV